MSVLLSATALTKSFTARPLFAGLTFDLRAGEKVGLIGPNGAGKSTLLKLLAGLEVPDEGTATSRRGGRIGYLAQDDAFTPGQTVEQAVLAALADDDLLEDYERDTLAASTLTQVGFTDFDQMASKLSGGWRKRLSLARELAKKPEFLLLDEPTNHLDLPGVVWLEKLLRAAPFGYLVATHDRAFLRAVADDIIEINRVYPAGFLRAAGGYDGFADKRDLFLEAQAKEQASLANQVRKETDWLAHKAQARTRKAASRIDAAHDKQRDLAELKGRTNSTGPAGIDFVGSGRQTRKLITAVGVSKSLGGRHLFGPIDIALAPGIKLGLLGPNGSGKSTILRLLSGELLTDTGTIVRADALQVALFEQGRAKLDLTASLRRTICPNGDSVNYRGRQVHVGGWARQFLFHPDQLDIPVGALSGGEQARVRIAQLMLLPADVLLLDEPTNDLDIPALEVLEESLSGFPGAVVLVTHDRDLLDRLCTEVIGLDGRGGAAPFGSVSQWLKAFGKAAPRQHPADDAPPGASPPAAVVVAKPAGKGKRLSFAEQKELDGIEAAIHTAEATVPACQAAVEAASTKGRQVLNEACAALDSANRRVEQLYARWAELEAKKA